MGMWAQLVGTGVGGSGASAQLAVGSGSVATDAASSSSTSPPHHSVVSPADAGLAVGLLHFAVAAGNSESAFVLAQRYSGGEGVPRDVEIAGALMRSAADASYENYNRVGNQVRGLSVNADTVTTRQTATAKGLMGRCLPTTLTSYLHSLRVVHSCLSAPVGAPAAHR